MDLKSAIGCSLVTAIGGAVLAWWWSVTHYAGPLHLAIVIGAVAGFAIGFAVILLLEAIGTE